MTEMIGNNGRWPFVPKPAKPPEPIAALPFVLALICAPLLVAATTFWIFLVPVFAVPFGAVPYLCGGIPTYIWMLSKGIRHPAHFALAGFILNLAICSAVALFLFMTEPSSLQAEQFAQIYLWFGSIFAPIWSAVFAWLYGQFQSSKHIN